MQLSSGVANFDGVTFLSHQLEWPQGDWQDRKKATSFWREYFSKEHMDQLSDPAFICGFIEGALAGWEKLRESLRPDEP
jgi:hypothetical protein